MLLFPLFINALSAFVIIVFGIHTTLTLKINISCFKILLKIVNSSSTLQKVGNSHESFYKAANPKEEKHELLKTYSRLNFSNTKVTFAINAKESKQKKKKSKENNATDLDRQHDQ